jgi:hypothetical protein
MSITLTLKTFDMWAYCNKMFTAAIIANETLTFHMSTFRMRFRTFEFHTIAELCTQVRHLAMIERAAHSIATFPTITAPASWCHIAKFIFA